MADKASVHSPGTTTPEARELLSKQEALAALTDQLAERELELATKKRTLYSFEQQYLRIVGARLAESDALEAAIAEALNRLRPSETTQQEAAAARAKATDSADACAALALPSTEAPPSNALKSLFREVAKRFHPDLAVDEADRIRRTAWMADANRAYQEGDERRLRELLDEWETSPEAVTGEGTAADLVRAIRKIYQVEQRLTAIASEMATVTDSELWALKTRVDADRTLGRDLLAEMAAEIDMQIQQFRVRLDELNTRTALS